jgi:hypothetical protein
MQKARKVVLGLRDAVHSALSSPALGQRGRFGGGATLKLPLAFVAYTLGIGFMAMDPWFGEKRFHWNQGVFVILVSYIVAATAAFEWNVLGRVRGVNLLLHFYLIAPLSLLFGRLVGRPTESHAPQSVLGKAVETVREFLGKTVGLSDVLPSWVLEPFASPATALFLIGICIVLSYGALRTRLGLLLLLIGFFAFSSFASDDPPAPVFCLGTLFLAAGLILHYHDIGHTVRQEQALRRLKDVHDDLERRCCLRIVQKVLEDGTMSEKGAFETVRRHYEAHARSAQEMALCARTVVNRLVYEHGILCLLGSSEGLSLAPSPKLNVQESFFSQLGVWPRNIVLAIIALLWLLLPLDALPDTIPFVGLLDDAVILMLGVMPLFQRIVAGSRAANLGPQSLS